MNEAADLTLRVSSLETQVAVMNGVLLIALNGTKKEKSEASEVIVRLDELANPSPDNPTENIANANPATSS